MTEKYILPQNYRQVEYIESTGTQYIDTGLNADYKLGLEVNYQMTRIIGNQRFGAVYDRGSGQYYRHHLIKMIVVCSGT